MLLLKELRTLSRNVSMAAWKDKHFFIFSSEHPGDSHPKGALSRGVDMVTSTITNMCVYIENISTSLL